MKALLRGKLLDRRYRILHTLARGGFGETYVAEDTRLPGHPKCVVKHLKPSDNSPRLLENAKRLFAIEAETLQRLGRHEQIPQLLAYFEEDREFYLVQELIEGHPLTQELQLGHHWTEPQVYGLLHEILTVLEFVHQHDVIHRDIKPDNIIRRTADQKLVLVDFGTVKQVIATQTQVGTTIVAGTPGYMPTEQGRGKPRPSSDIYALGVIGIQAFTGLTPAQLQEDPNSGEIVWQPWAECSDGLAQILNRMVRYHFKERYPSATEALQDLAVVMQSTSPSAALTPTTELSFAPTTSHPIANTDGSPLPSPDPLPALPDLSATQVSFKPRSQDTLPAPEPDAEAPVLDPEISQSASEVVHQDLRPALSLATSPGASPAVVPEPESIAEPASELLQAPLDASLQANSFQEDVPLAVTGEADLPLESLANIELEALLDVNEAQSPLPESVLSETAAIAEPTAIANTQVSLPSPSPATQVSLSPKAQALPGESTVRPVSTLMSPPAQISESAAGSGAKRTMFAAPPTSGTATLPKPSQPAPTGKPRLKRGLLRGVGLGALGIGAIATTLYFVHQQQVTQTAGRALEALQAAKTEKRYQDCLQLANTFPSLVPPWDNTVQTVQGDCQFARGQELAKQGSYREAIALLSQIPNSHATANPAKPLIQQWSEQILELANEKYQNGKLQDAVAIASAIPKTSPVHAKAQSEIKRWNEEWKANETRYKAIEKAIQEQRWQVALNEAEKLTASHWKNKSKPLVQQANDELAASVPVRTAPISAPAQPDYTAPAASQSVEPPYEPPYEPQYVEPQYSAPPPEPQYYEPPAPAYEPPPAAPAAPVTDPNCAHQAACL
jgi:serine/threonine protein kinase/tetratricopeptide (TPR) repeat protein